MEGLNLPMKRKFLPMGKIGRWERWPEASCIRVTFRHNVHHRMRKKKTWPSIHGKKTIFIARTRDRFQRGTNSKLQDDARSSFRWNKKAPSNLHSTWKSIYKRFSSSFLLNFQVDSSRDHFVKVTLTTCQPSNLKSSPVVLLAITTVLASMCSEPKRFHGHLND